MKTRDFTKLMLEHYDDTLEDFLGSYVEGLECQLKEARERGRFLRQELKIFNELLDMIKANPKEARMIIKELFKGETL